MTAAAFTYDNRNPRSPTVVGRALRLIPGVRHVASQTAPYAQWWREQNLATLAAPDGPPLWVVLGDSMSQGIGASDVLEGWVPRVARELDARGMPVRVLNLSFSGARTAEVAELQLPAFLATGQQAAVVSVMIGSNDLVRRSLREALPQRYEELLAQLPDGTLFATWPSGGLAPYRRFVEQHAGVVPVPLRMAPGGIAEDRYHPNDQSYAAMADGFIEPLAAAVRRSR